MGWEDAANNAPNDDCLDRDRFEGHVFRRFLERESATILPPRDGWSRLENALLSTAAERDLTPSRWFVVSRSARRLAAAASIAAVCAWTLIAVSPEAFDWRFTARRIALPDYALDAGADVLMARNAARERRVTTTRVASAPVYEFVSPRALESIRGGQLPDSGSRPWEIIPDSPRSASPFGARLIRPAVADPEVPVRPGLARFTNM